MISEEYKKRAHKVIKQAQKRNLIKTYDEFSKTDLAKKTALNEEEVNYYVSNYQNNIK